MQSYRDLIAWRKAMDLVAHIYAVTKDWPREEIYGLTGQVRRAVVSIPANIAEGQGRRGKSELSHHLSIASGSLHEAETHRLIAQRLGYTDEPTTTNLLAQSAEVGRLIYGLMRSITPPTTSHPRPGTAPVPLTTDD